MLAFSQQRENCAPFKNFRATELQMLAQDFVAAVQHTIVSCEAYLKQTPIRFADRQTTRQLCFESGFI